MQQLTDNSDYSRFQRLLKSCYQELNLSIAQDKCKISSDELERMLQSATLEQRQAFDYFQSNQNRLYAQRLLALGQQHLLTLLTTGRVTKSVKTETIIQPDGSEILRTTQEHKVQAPSIADVQAVLRLFTGESDMSDKSDQYDDRIQKALNRATEKLIMGS